jgi:CheY-like chemotaxis protein/anti-sigma regulatory factor (Ser/Thr protein kinase)
MKVFTRTEDDPALRVDPNRAVSLAVRLMSNEIRNRAELFTRLGDVQPVLADEGKLVQVLVNVLTNALQALDGSSRRSIDIVTDGVERDSVRITITDTGRGIAPEHVVRVFEPFFTTKPVGEGLGLGLSIAHTVITGFGGTISVSSELSVGTTVVITLPTAIGNRDAQEKQVSAAVSVQRARVLVVDDETMIGTAIRRILVKQGLEVTVEDGGRAAFDRLAAGERFDVVLCDLMMPGFSGADFYDGLDAVAPEMKSRVVFMTGNAFTPRASELFEKTTNVRLDKPFVPADLTRVVGEVLRRHGDVA